MSKSIQIFLIFIFCWIPEICNSQSWFWIEFADKTGSQYSISKPEEFLSERAIQRRIRQNIPIDETDLPVSKVYIDSIINTGVEHIHSSKWLNGITVRAENDTLAEIWRDFGFVSDVQLSKPYRTSLKKAINKFGESSNETIIDTSLYGTSVHQVSQLNGHYFHQKGIKGQGMVIAVLDAGFYNADKLPSLSNLYETGKILGTRDFVNPSSDFYTEHWHGMMVLSTMGGYLPGELIGTAPEASYWLLRTEDAASEYLIEEDNWVAGAEFADSVGADIINSSLGYYEFDDSTMNHTYADMDGKTTRVTRGANMAASKGMLVFSSAGNEARNNWRKIIAPADGDHVIAVGAIDRNRNYASFSSVGPAADGAVKPDLAAMGSGTAVQGIIWDIVARSGTSFASPVLAGMAACLWQANPTVTAKEMARIMMLTGHQAIKPDTLLGYGIPDMQLADLILNQFNVPVAESSKNWKVFPNPFQSTLTIFSDSGFIGEVDIELSTLSGITVSKSSFHSGEYIRINHFSQLPAGLYLLKISGDTFAETHRILKTR
jgi:serine protease AprX